MATMTELDSTLILVSSEEEFIARLSSSMRELLTDLKQHIPLPTDKPTMFHIMLDDTSGAGSRIILGVEVKKLIYKQCLECDQLAHLKAGYCERCNSEQFSFRFP